MDFLTLFGLKKCVQTETNNNNNNNNSKNSVCSEQGQSLSLDLLNLVMEYLAHCLQDIVALACTNKTLYCLILLDNDNNKNYNDGCTNQLWLTAGRILVQEMLFGMEKNKEIDFWNTFCCIPVSPSDDNCAYCYYNQNYSLLARCTNTAKSRHFSKQRFDARIPTSSTTTSTTTQQQQQPLHSHLSLNGIQLRWICFYLFRCSKMDPMRLYCMWLDHCKKQQQASSSSSLLLLSLLLLDHGCPLACMPSGNLVGGNVVGTVLRRFQFEKKVRNQVHDYIQRVKNSSSNNDDNENHNNNLRKVEFKFYTNQSSFLSRQEQFQQDNQVEEDDDDDTIEDNNNEDNDLFEDDNDNDDTDEDDDNDNNNNECNLDRIAAALEFLANTLSYDDDHRLASSHDWNVENYKYDLRIGLRTECTVIGKRGWAAKFKLRAMSDHCYWSAGSHLECAVTLCQTCSLADNNNNKIRVLRRQGEIHHQQDVVGHSSKKHSQTSEKKKDGNDDNDDDYWSSTSSGGGYCSNEESSVTAEQLVYGPLAEFTGEDTGSLGGGFVKVNGILLKHVGNELGIPEVPVDMLWDFIFCAMVPRIPRLYVPNHAMPPLSE